jgi:hypothetical protein
MGLDWIIGGIGAAIVAVVAAWFGGQSRGKVKGRAAEQAAHQKAARETEDRVDAAIRNARDAGGGWHDRLHETRR